MSSLITTVVACETSNMAIKVNYLLQVINIYAFILKATHTVTCPLPRRGCASPRPQLPAAAFPTGLGTGRQVDHHGNTQCHGQVLPTDRFTPSSHPTGNFTDLIKISFGQNDALRRGPNWSVLHRTAEKNIFLAPPWFLPSSAVKLVPLAQRRLR